MRHILLVDDEPEVIEGQLLILRGLQDVTLHTAYFANEALKLLDQYPVSLVIADIRMPGMNGIEMWEEIHRRSPQCRVIFLSGVRDFDNIYRIIQSPNARFLTKMEPEEKILATVDEALAELDQQDAEQAERQRWQFSAFLTGSETDSAQAQRQLEETPGPLMMTQGVGFALCGTAHSWAQSRQERRDALHQLSIRMKQQMPDAPSHFIRLPELCGLWLIQAPADSRHAAEFPRVIRRTCQAMEAESGLLFRCVWAVGVTSLDALRESYHEAMDWVARSDVPQEQVLSLAEARAENRTANHDRLMKIRFNQQALQSYIQLGQRENYRSLVSAMYRYCIQPELDVQALLHVHFGVMAQLFQCLDGHEDNGLRERLRREHLTMPDQQTDWQAALDRLLDYCDEAFDLLFPADPYSHPEVVSSIQRYIGDHLDQDLSLNALSARFNMNPNYLSRLFRETTGHKLHEYITQLRLGTAERLLRSGGGKVNEIALQVGYDSAHTFIRAFRKQFGVTPAEYRAKKGADD